MNLLMAITLALTVTFVVVDDPKSPAEEAIDKATASLQGTLSKMSALDETDKKLAKSNQVQIETTEMLNRLENKILHQDGPALQQKANQWESKRQQHIASGCPEEGGRAPVDVARRCNAETDVLLAEKNKLLNESESLKKQVADIAKTRQAVSETTLEIFTQQKKNRNLREELEATKKSQEKLVQQLKADRIAASVKPLEAKKKASESCKKFSDEKLSCCNQVVFDNRNPMECDIELLYTTFKRDGVFGGAEVKPKKP